MTSWDTLADDETIEKTAKALEARGIAAFVVASGAEAKEKTLDLIPAGSEVMTMSSVTLDAIGLSEELNKADGKYKPVRDKLYAMDRKTQAQEMNCMGAAPQVAVGSVHAITVDGQVFVASNTGSQLPAYAYSALKVIWVAGAQKIVKTLDNAMKRLYEHNLVLESERARKAYGVAGSAVNKILIVNGEIQPGRMTIILVREKLGF